MRQSKKKAQVKKRVRKAPPGADPLGRALSVRGHDPAFPPFHEVYLRSQGSLPPNVKAAGSRRSVRWAMGLGAVAALVIAAVFLLPVSEILGPAGRVAAGFAVDARRGVSRFSSGSAKPTALTSGGSIVEGDAVVISGTGFTDVMLSGDRAFRFEGPGRLQIVRLRQGAAGVTARIRLSSGRLWSSLNPVSGAGEYIIETPHATVRTLGTQFLVSVSASGAVCSVFRGRVEVRPRSGSPVVVGAGFAVDVAAGKPMAGSRAISLRPGLVRFRRLQAMLGDSGLAEVLALHNRPGRANSQSREANAKADKVGDRVVLKTGSTLVGEIAFQDQARVVIRTLNGIQIVPKSKVRSIQPGD